MSATTISGKSMQPVLRTSSLPTERWRIGFRPDPLHGVSAEDDVDVRQVRHSQRVRLGPKSPAGSLKRHFAKRQEERTGHNIEWRDRYQRQLQPAIGD